MAFYQRLKDLKEDADLTQAEISEIIEVSANHYGKYERGETDIPFSKAIKLADYYDVSLDYIAGRTNNKTFCREISSSCFTEKFNQLNEKNKARIDERMSQLIETQKNKPRPYPHHTGAAWRRHLSCDTASRKSARSRRAQRALRKVPARLCRVGQAFSGRLRTGTGRI